MSYDITFTCFNQNRMTLPQVGRFSSKWPLKTNISTYLKVLKRDCFIDRRKKIIDRDYTINQIWSIGGETGWYYGLVMGFKRFY
jgi:hypothetical protein